MKLLNLTISLLLMGSTAVMAQDTDASEKQTGEEIKIVKVLENFRTAIVNNNQDKASELLTNDARILEGGGIETKKEYLSHHFHSDSKFLSAMDRKVISRKIKSARATAWVSTTSRMSGTYNNSELSINSAELAVLVKQKDSWKISAVHWSSGSAK